MRTSKTLKYFINGYSKSVDNSFKLTINEIDEVGNYGLSVPIKVDIEAKKSAMEKIRIQPFTSNSKKSEYSPVQRWIEECGKQVLLPINFCGGLFLIRVYRLLVPPAEQTQIWMKAVYTAAAAYDFAFLALGHADDEADMTILRDGKPTRFITFPDTRIVDGINLLLTGETALLNVLGEWPQPLINSDGNNMIGPHPLSIDIIKGLIKALREASFPILLDRAGTGHVTAGKKSSSGLKPILIDSESLKRVEAFNHYRAHTYFMRAFDIATLIAGFDDIEAELSEVIDELFSLWGTLGAATDDLQDIFIDFASGVHSICSVMAHMCVAEEKMFRPRCRQYLPEKLLKIQRIRLEEYFGKPEDEIDPKILIKFLQEIELDRALEEHLEIQSTRFVTKLGEAMLRFGISPELLMEMASYVCREPELLVPEKYLIIFKDTHGENERKVLNANAGQFIAKNIIQRFWPNFNSDSF